MTGSDTLGVWKDGGLVDDPWQYAGGPQAETGQDDRPTIVPLASFAQAPQVHTAARKPLGIHVPGGADIAPLLPHLSGIALIALEFASFADGRNYSTARLLREKHGYGGELRAVGEVLADQIPLMRRCGINAYAIAHAQTLKALQEGALAEVDYHYQPVTAVGAGSEIPAGTRPWTRRSVAGRRQAG